MFAFYFSGVNYDYGRTWFVEYPEESEIIADCVTSLGDQPITYGVPVTLRLHTLNNYVMKVGPCVCVCVCVWIGEYYIKCLTMPQGSQSLTADIIFIEHYDN